MRKEDLENILVVLREKGKGFSICDDWMV